MGDPYDEGIVEVDEPPHHEISTRPDPLRIRGMGNVTVFGLSNRFSSEFPSLLVGKVASEEFEATMGRINAYLGHTVPFNIKWLLCGCLCCCCTLGCSMVPVVYLNKRTKIRLEKALAWENSRLYNRLGMHWRLSKEQCADVNMREYVLFVEFLPREDIYSPD